MSKYLDLKIEEIHTLLKNKEIKPMDLVLESFARIEKNKELNAFITLCKEEAIQRAKELENREVDSLLFGLPIAIKDNISTKDLRTTCASKMLENYVPVFDAAVIEKINELGMIIVGKTNMDEFAMGSTSRTSYFGAPKNPHNKTRISGGSSGGSAVSVAGRLVPFALGSDTGGSIRQPASYTGIVGMKPTYGRVSRFGLIAYASSMDQIGPMTRNVYENALLLNELVGKDSRDLTSARRETEDFTRYIGKDIKGMKIGVPTYFMSDVVSTEIKKQIENIIDLLKEKGAHVDSIHIPFIENTVNIYQIIAMGEASSNLARFDGVRFGYSYENPKSVEELYMKTRALGFGEEVKRRIMIGSYLLSGENAQIYYDKALSLRDDIRKSFREAFESYDLIIGPTTTTTAYSLEEDSNPLKAFLDDVLVIPVNMAGLPGMSIPVGFDREKMPIGLHIIGNAFEEAKMYQLASYLEKGCNLVLEPKDGE